MEKGKPGRKKIKLNDEESLRKIVELGAQGLTSGQIAKCLGVSWSTIDRRRKEFGEIEEAIKKGEALGVQQVSNALMRSAVEDKNVTAQIFYLKNRAPDQWADRQEINYNLDLKNVLTDARARIIEHQAPAHALKDAQALSDNAQREAASEGANE